ncbi:MAG TPA: hypothetical protein VN132_08700 [Bdellovibrio sp.]|nr:hypothetical protein [Bdellovibrio sp.]
MARALVLLNIWMLSVLSFGGSLTTAFAAENAQPSSKPCLSEAEVREAQTKVQFLKDFSVDDLCRPESHTYKLAETVLFIKNFRWDLEKNKNNPFDQNIVSDSFWDFFNAEPSKTLEDFTEETAANANVLAVSLGALQDGNIYIMSSFYSDKNTVFTRVSALMHEAHHFSGADHVVCENGVSVGGKNCDESVEEKGAWAVTLEVMSKMLLGTGKTPKPTPEEREEIKQETLTLSHFVFNKRPSFEAVYLLAENGDGYIFDGVQAVKVRGVQKSKILSRLQSLLSFPDGHISPSTLSVYSSDLSLRPPSGVTAIQYANQPLENRKDIIDIFNLDHCLAGVYDNEAVLNDWPSVVFKDWKAAKAFCGSESENLNNEAFYITDTEGRSHELTLKDGKVSVKDLEQDPFKGWKTLAQLKNVTLGFSDQGNLLMKNSDGKWVSFTQGPLAGKKFRSMTRPFLWSGFLFGL